MRASQSVGTGTFEAEVSGLDWRAMANAASAETSDREAHPGRDVVARSPLEGRCGYQAKWAKALLASAMRWTFSRRLMAAPSRL